jgi:hypothetical protein
MSAFTALGRGLRKQNEETQTKRSTSLALVTVQHVVLWTSLVAMVVGVALLAKTRNAVDPSGILVVVSVSQRIHSANVMLMDIVFNFDYICIVTQPSFLPPLARRDDRTPKGTKLQATPVFGGKINWLDMHLVASLLWLGSHDGRETAGLSRGRQGSFMGCWLTLCAGANWHGAFYISSVSVLPSLRI